MKWYNDIWQSLVEGPLAVDVIHGFLDDSEELLTDLLLADPNNKIGNTPEAIAAHFDGLRNWVSARHANVSAQLEAEAH